MKNVIGVLILIAAGLFVKQLFTKYESIKAEAEKPSTRATQKIAPSSDLPGLPISLESSLATAKQKGADGLRAWLKSYRHTIVDPRLADIELDYVVLVNRQDPAEARRVFQAVQSRVPSNSPVYPRVRSLERTYGTP